MSSTPLHLLRKSTHVGVLLAMAAMVSTSGLAATGAPDRSFGSQGTVITDFANASDNIVSIALQQDGAIVVLGRRVSPLPTGFVLARYLPNGDLDPAFGAGGSVLAMPAPGESLTPAGLAIQRDGKLITAGYTYLTGLYDQVVHLARYHPDGSLDTPFGQGGLSTPAVNLSVRAVAIQEDGGILVTGFADNDLAVARYLANGTLDVSFGDQGIARVQGEEYASGSALAIQPDGAIVVVGEIGDHNGNTFMMATRLDAAGHLDTGFGTNGLTVIKPRRDSWWDSSSGVALQADGSVMVFGSSTPSTSFTPDMVFARLTPDGLLDGAFHGNGVRLIDGRTEVSALAAGVIQPDGRIFGVGSDGGQYSRMTGLRLNADSTYDTTFSGDGWVARKAGDVSYSRAIATDPEGRLVVAGYAYTASTGTYNDFALLRYLANDVDNDGVAEPWDTRPDTLGFTAQTGLPAGTVALSETVTLSGLGQDVAVPVKVTGGEYAVNGGAFTAHPGYVRNGDTLALRLVSAGTNVCATATLDVGGLYAGNSTHLVLGQNSVVSAGFQVGCQ